MKFTVEVGALKPAVKTLVRWGQGKAFQNFRHAELKAEGDLLEITFTTEAGSAHISVDADVSMPGSIGVDIELLSKILAPVRVKNWDMSLSLEPDPKVDGRQLFVARFREDGCKRNTVHWPYTGRRGEVFTNTDWVPDPIQPSGVIKEFRAPRSRMVQLMQSGLAGHSTVERSQSELHSAGLTVAGDLAAAYALNAKFGIRSQLFADGDLGFDTGWEGDPLTLSLDAVSLGRATGFLEAFGGEDPWLVQIPDDGPIRMCPASDPSGAWVTVPQTSSAVDLPEMLDQLRASKDSDSVTRIEATIGLNRRVGEKQKLRGLIAELELLEAYASADSEAETLTLSMEEDALVLEATSRMHIGGGVEIPWLVPPNRAVVRSVSCKNLLTCLKAITATSDPDAEIQLVFWADSDSDLERLYLSTSSERGEAADCLLMPVDRPGGVRRLADMVAEEVE